MVQAYLISVQPAAGGESLPGSSSYAALAGTPEEAVELVRPLLSSDAEPRWTGDTLSAGAALALGLRQGQARLV